MNNNYLAICFTAIHFFTFVGNGLFAQTPVELSVGSATVSQGQNECLPVTVSNFTEIVTMQWSLRWDPALIEYTNVDFGSNPLGLNATQINSPNDSTLRMSWLEPNNQLITLAGEQILLSVCFNALNSGVTSLAFEQDLPTEFIGSEFMEVPANTTDGTVMIPPGPALLSILPGDTNNDSIVNADDLLGIGLAFGSTGPAREPATTNFEFVNGLPWDQSTPQSEVNFALVNADGNTTINNLDQTVVELNFGQMIPGASGTPQYPFMTGAFINFESSPVESGQFLVLDLLLGQDEVIPPGYGISFTVEVDPSLFDLSDFTYNSSGNIIGDDVLTLVEVSPVNPGMIEIAIVRKDQQNNISTAGSIGSLSLRTNDVFADTETPITIRSIRYIDKDENTLGGASTVTSATILAPVSTREPAWAEAISIGPNPVIGDKLNISGVLANKVAKLTLIDLNNRILGTYPVDTENINVSDLVAGTYYLIFSDKNTATLLARKIVVQ
ncbi:hypothetical protein CEQ90_01275 [Lewinellaceae bacterium SD302]|nr:hypothetical protein CEQ90_01275 [Lewinellaceae bacterium SD302]